jgi:putative ABC transport system permease protein
MEHWKKLARMIRSVAGRGPVDRDLDAEVTGYLEMLADEKTAAGTPREEAVRQARLEMGGVEQVKEAVRAVRPAAWLDTLARDLRHGLRQLTKAPAFSVTVVLVLALGIGANVAVFGLVNLLLLQPRVGSDQPGELVALHVHVARNPASYRRFSWAEFEEIRRSVPAFGTVAAYRNLRVLLTNGDESRRVSASAVSASYFSTLGARLVAGRAFTPEEEHPGSGAAVAVVNYETWQDLGGGTGVLGSTIRVNAHPFTVIGIAPKGFAGMVVAFGPSLWVPIGASALVDEDGPRVLVAPDAELLRRNLGLAGRLRPATTVDEANAVLTSLSSQLESVRGADGTPDVIAAHLPARTEDGDAPGDDAGLLLPLGTLAGMAGVLLLVASLNVANMQLARGTTRRKEVATRLALGAGRGRIVFQLLVEGLLLSLAGGVGGLVLGVGALQFTAASFTPVIDESLTGFLGPDLRVVLATFAYAVLAALVFALGPSLRLSRPDLLSDLKNSSAGSAGQSRRRLAGPRHVVVACQVAPALALLATAGLFVRGALAAGQADPGFPLEHQVLVRVATAAVGPAESQQAFSDLVDRLRGTPGIASASAASLVAFGNSHSSHRVEAEGEGPAPSRTGAVAQHYAVGADYFRTLGLPVLRGREFTRGEDQDGTTSRAVIIDEPLARAIFPGRDPVGRFVQFPGRTNERPETYEVVGLAAGQRDRITDAAPVAHVYRPLGASRHGHLNVHVRLAAVPQGTSSQAVGLVRDVVRASGPRLAIVDVSTFEDARDRVPLHWLVRAAASAFGALGIVALVMAVTGLNGVKAYLVARRSREIGIRMALGATPRQIASMVLRDGSAVLGLGLLVGFLAALGAGFLVSRLLVGVRPLDPVVFMLATVVLTSAVLVASYVPARRATRVDPAVAFRSE